MTYRSYPETPKSLGKSISKMFISRIILRFMRFYCLAAIIWELKALPDISKSKANQAASAWNGGEMEVR